MSDELDLTEIQYRPLSDECPRGAFSCGVPEIDKWFLKRSIEHQRDLKCRVTSVHLGDSNDVVAFFSLKITLEDERLLPKTNPLRAWANYRVYPALHLEWLAVDNAYQHQKVGTTIMGRVLEIFHQAVLDTGIPVLTLMPIDDAVQAFYASLGFESYAAHMGHRNMMLPGRTVLDMYEKAMAS